MKRSSGLRHLSLKTSALDETLRFYTEVLGLEIAFQVPPRRVFLRWPGQDDLLDFVHTRSKFKPNLGMDHFGLKTTAAGLRALDKKLKQNRVRIEGRRGRNSIYFRDPNGYLVECYCD